ncbi:MAG: hypothetical protein RBU30_12520 [Polyangia bacterium]|nr:hypothetical protein [Polyangia bacterium]
MNINLGARAGASRSVTSWQKSSPQTRPWRSAALSARLSAASLHLCASLCLLLAACGDGGGHGLNNSNQNQNLNGNHNGNQNENQNQNQSLCGNGALDTGEACDEGALNSDTLPNRCRTSCLLPSCGDGVTDSGHPLNEQCDSGAGNSDTAPDACRTSCLLPSCGDGVADQGEECDSGASNSDTAPDACRTSCLLPSCGDGVVDTGEDCDDALYNSDTVPDACRTSCLTAGCGDGVVDTGEDCDEGAGNSDTAPNACRTSCLAASCGDGVVDQGEECDSGASNSDTAPNACRTSCLLPSCGDGVVDQGEECDSGAANSDTDPNACRTSCLAASCGDGVVDQGEECDNALFNSDTVPDACRTSCLAASCGDGVADTGEECDGADLRFVVCLGMGYPYGGTLSCTGCLMDVTTCCEPRPPAVTSMDTSFAPLNDGIYRLTFNVPVLDVEASLAWTQITGSGVLGTVTQVDPSTYDVSFTGSAPGDAYTLTVGLGVADRCGNHLAAPVSLQLAIDQQHGATCEDPHDVSGVSFPYGLVGPFDWDGPGGSCDATATNAVFFSFTPQASGDYRVELINNTTTAAYTRLAIYEGLACDPFGPELSCMTYSVPEGVLFASLEGGTTYLVQAYTDGEPYTMVDPQISVSLLEDPGMTCPLAADISSEPFPFSLTGDFEWDGPGGSCDPSATNSVFYSFVPSVSDYYKVIVANGTTDFAGSRIALYQGDACSPYGPEVACVSSSGKTGAAFPELESGTTYLIQAYTDGNSYSMTDPQVTVAQAGEGDLCHLAADISTAAFPFSLSGQFEWDGEGGSCDTSATNSVFFTYMPTASGTYRIDTANNSPSSAYTRIAVFQGDGCNPRGTELACVTSYSKTGSALVDLEGSNFYLIQVYTDSNSYTMVDPEITVSAVTLQPAESCSSAVDISFEPFPFGLVGTFEYDFTGGSCDPSATNSVFYTYTPATTGAFRIDTVNNSTSPAYTRIAVFEGNGCSPRGQELACVTSYSKTGSAVVELVTSTPYLIQVYTDSDGYTMVDPQISVTQLALGPGESCSTAAEISSVSFPYALTGTFDLDGPGGSCDPEATNSVFYTFTPASSGAYEVTVTNDSTTLAYSRLVLFDGAGCAPRGPEIHCETAFSKTLTTSVSLTAGRPYLVQFYTDGSTYTMVDPVIIVTSL